MAIFSQGVPLTEIEFKPGDEFVVVGEAAISKIIQYVSKGKASHGGLITDKVGNTIEALNSGIKEDHISRYVGKSILIVRPKGIDSDKINNAIESVKDRWLGKNYPWHRMVPHLLASVIPFMGKINLIGIPVCSELVAYYEWLISIRKGEHIWGVNPDDLMDYWVMTGSKYEIVYRGILVK